MTRDMLAAIAGKYEELVGRIREQIPDGLRRKPEPKPKNSTESMSN
jgi:hypothetical protein